MGHEKLALVTGPGGCVGSAVAAALRADGWTVRGLVRRPSDPSLIDQRHVGDLTRPASLSGASRGARLVVHTAAMLSDWRPGPRIWQVNRDGTRALLEDALRCGVQRFVYLSTVDVFGFNGRTTISERSPRRCPASAYSRSKLAGENLAWSYLRRGLDVTVVYPTWVFGPGDRHLLPELAGNLRNGRLVHLDHGRAPLELTYSHNLAEAIVLAATTPSAGGEGYVVGDSYGLTTGRFFDLLAEHMGVPPVRRSLGYRTAMAAAALSETAAALRRRPTRPMLTRYAVQSIAAGTRYDLSRITALGYKPRTNIHEALRATLATWPPQSP
ncbi:NAD-dependent epimerase/dehydratase family protein [Actinomadura gamaensis]|uniref:NAD-dependent epimerase/dehydratase family protein n=1 Tax=Actinomadura gamaensis TaxID=1763541 RepID=A0ABV9TXI6_9ACTN